jgi:hypothetical protein
MDFASKLASGMIRKTQESNPYRTGEQQAAVSEDANFVRGIVG